MANSAYDILGLLNEQGQKNVALVSSLIDSGFRNATVGIKQSSDIMSQTVSAALDYKKTLVDEWYKGEVLQRQDQELRANIAYRDATLKLQERQLDITEQRYKDLDAREREQTELSARNKQTYGLLSEKRRLYESSIRGIQNLMQSNQHTLQTLEKSINEQGHRWPKSQYEAARARVEELQAKIIGGSNQINNLIGDLGNLNNAISGLANGIIDSDSALNELEYLSPEVKNASPEARPLGVQTAPPSEGGRGPLGSVPSVPDGERPLGRPPGGVALIPNRSSFSQFNPQADPSTDPANFLPVNEDDERYGLQETLAITQRLFENAGNAALPEINNFINNRATNEAQRYFQDKRVALEKKYFQDLFADITIGKENAAPFRLDKDSFTKQYLYYGGSEETLDNIKQFVGTKIREISETSTVEEQNKKIQDLYSQIFTEANQKNMNTTAEGYKTPPKMIGSSGMLIKVNEQGEYEIKTVPDELEERPITALDRQIAEQGGKDRDILNKVIGGFDAEGKRVNGYALTKDKNGKTTLSKRALETIAGIKYNDLVELGVIKPFTVNTSQSGTLLSNEVKHSWLNAETKERINKDREKAIRELVKPENRGKALSLLIKLESM